MTFSFSRLSLYDTCPYAFYKRYIEGDSGDSNFYAENGSIFHDLIRLVLLKEMTLEEAATEYQNRFDSIYYSVKESTMDKTYSECIDYICTVDEFDFDKYEIIDLENRIEFKIGKYNFVTIPDLILKNRKTGEVILIDHKSADHFFKKDGTVLKAQQDNFNKYRKQMYIYCKGIKDVYDLQVNKIAWHHFKDKGAISAIEFNQEDYENVLNWCLYIIEKMKKDKKFEPCKSYMMCGQLCNFRYSCEYLEEDEEE